MEARKETPPAFAQWLAEHYPHMTGYSIVALREAWIAGRDAGLAIAGKQREVA